MKVLVVAALLVGIIISDEDLPADEPGIIFCISVFFIFLILYTLPPLKSVHKEWDDTTCIILF